jgi:hypothetical protein
MRASACKRALLRAAVRARAVRHSERPIQVEHQLDVVLREDLFVDERDPAARDPERLDDADEIGRRRREQELPFAELARVLEAMKR